MNANSLIQDMNTDSNSSFYDNDRYTKRVSFSYKQLGILESSILVGNVNSKSNFNQNVIGLRGLENFIYFQVFQTSWKYIKELRLWVCLCLCATVPDCSSYLNGLLDRKQLAVHLLFSGVLLQGFFQDSIHHLCVIPIQLFLHMFY